MKKEKTCKDCRDRTIEPNCHMTCEKYLKAKEKMAGVNRCISRHFNEVANSNCVKKRAMRY